MAGSQNSPGSLALLAVFANGARDQTNMAQLSKAIFGAFAISLTLGAAQLASGHDLSGNQQALTDTPATTINRSAKTDRAAGAAGSAEQTQTISLRLESLSDTTVLVRMPFAKKPETAVPNGPAVRSLFKSSDRKPPVGCEPVFSVLSEAARQLQPGRCVT